MFCLVIVFFFLQKIMFMCLTKISIQLVYLVSISYATHPLQICNILSRLTLGLRLIAGET